MARHNRAGADRATVEDRWRRLTWDDLEAWAGSRSLQRGRSYQRSGHVQQLARTEDGVLLAWVQGTERYATEVELADEPDEEPALISRCTCPVGVACKHAVAVVVDYLDALKNGRDVPVAGASDRRRRLLDEETPEEDFDEDYSDEEDEETDEEEPVPALRRGARARGEPPSSRRGGAGRRDDMRAYLESLPASDLVAYLLDLAQQYPEVERDLKARSALARGKAGELIREARQEIRQLTHEPAWVNAWTGEGELPDYSGLKRLFERLLAMGQADALLGLGETLLESGNDQIGASHDEGETATEVGACLEVVFRAVLASTRPDAQKLLYTIDLVLRDEYDLCQGAEVVLDRDWPAPAWSAVADDLARRLQDLPAPRGDDFSSRYRRDRLSNWLIRALRQSGRKAEVVPLLEAEARLTASYDRLVEALLAARRLEDARRWALEGIEQTKCRWPGIAERLRESLREMAARQKDWPTVAAMRAEDFFAYPSVAGLEELEKAAERAGCRAEVRAAALHFLETGVRPAPPPTATPASPRRAARLRPAKPETPSWPLPDLSPDLRPAGVPARRSREGPHFDVLLDLALEEKRPDDVLRWYDRGRKAHGARSYGWYGGSGLEGQVADAVAEAHPDRAASLYQAIIARYIAQTSPSAYEAALPYLRKLRQLLHRLGRTEEWRQYLARLRETERRKRRLMEVLDCLERRPIVEG
jgi:uncharacterized Zn finger protein